MSYQRCPPSSIPIVEDMIYIIQQNPNSPQVTRDELQADWKAIEDSLIKYGLLQNIDAKGIRTLAVIRVLEITFGGQSALGKIVTIVDDAGKLSVKGRKDGRLPRLGVLVHEEKVKQFVIFLEGIIFCNVESNNLVLALLSYMGVHFLCNFDYARAVKSACQFLEYFWLTSKDKNTIRGWVRQLGLAIMGNV
ncbi:uncharacterized protein [Ptychodera flava]|uniref:uncharacterized protein isoform X1 n=1 Tax=Ptychodera flava TaxID=63121 RepID=UPI00396AA891